MLEHHAHALAVDIDVDRRVGDIHAVKDDLPAGGMLQQVQAPQKGGFAAARGADHHHHLAPVNLRAYIAERHEHAVIKGFAQVFYIDQYVSGHCCAASFPGAKPAW